MAGRPVRVLTPVARVALRRHRSDAEMRPILELRALAEPLAARLEGLTAL
jgi:hypothetical protein